MYLQKIRNFSSKICYIKNINNCKGNKNEIFNYLHGTKGKFLSNEYNLLISHFYCTKFGDTRTISDKWKDSSKKLDPKPYSDLKNEPFNKNSNLLNMKEMNISELEAHLVELKSKNMNTRGILRKLIIIYTSQKNVKRCQEIFQEIREMETKMSPGMLSSLLQVKIYEKDVEGALECYYLLSFEDSSFFLDSYKVVDLCSLLVTQGKTDDAFQVLRDYVNTAPNSYHNKKAIMRNCHKLLDLVSVTNGYSMTKKFSSLLFAGGLAEPSTILLGIHIKAKLISNDVSGAVSEAEDIYAKYQLLPYRVEIFIQLLRKVNSLKEIKGYFKETKSNDSQEFAALIDKMISLCTAARGFKQAREDLLAASIEVGIFNECLRIFKFVEKGLKIERLRQLCNNYVRNEKTHSLLMLLKISKNSNKVDRLYICQCLLNIYSVRRSGSDALNLWTVMQEEEVTPSDYFMGKLTSILKTSNTSSPFVHD